MAEQTDKVFVSGMYLDRVHENAPAFILTNQTIHVEKFIQWLQANKHLATDKGYIKVVGKESQNKDEKGMNKRYFEVDQWKPVDNAQPPVADSAKTTPTGTNPQDSQDAPDLTESDLPW